MDYADRIRELVIREDVPTLLERYLDPDGRYAALSFDLAGENPPNEISSDDLLALNFLDVPIQPLSYRRFQAIKTEANELLEGLSTDLPLWEMIDQKEAFSAANKLWHLLVGLPDIGPTTASKLMARKRPGMIPILDRWVREFYGGATEDYWQPLGRALWDETLRQQIHAARPRGDADKLSLLRILDIAIWMTGGKPPPSSEGELKTA